MYIYICIYTHIYIHPTFKFISSSQVEACKVAPRMHELIGFYSDSDLCDLAKPSSHKSNTLQYPAAHCNTLQHPATPNTLQHTATNTTHNSSSLAAISSATHGSPIQFTATSHSDLLQLTAMPNDTAKVGGAAGAAGRGETRHRQRESEKDWRASETQRDEGGHLTQQPTTPLQHTATRCNTSQPLVFQSDGGKHDNEERAEECMSASGQGTSLANKEFATHSCIEFVTHLCAQNHLFASEQVISLENTRVPSAAAHIAHAHTTFERETHPDPPPPTPTQPPPPPPTPPPFPPPPPRPHRAGHQRHHPDPPPPPPPVAHPLAHPLWASLFLLLQVGAPLRIQIEYLLDPPSPQQSLPPFLSAHPPFSVTDMEGKDSWWGVEQQRIVTVRV